MQYNKSIVNSHPMNLLSPPVKHFYKALLTNSDTTVSEKYYISRERRTYRADAHPSDLVTFALYHQTPSFAVGDLYKSIM